MKNILRCFALLCALSTSGCGSGEEIVTSGSGGGDGTGETGGGGTVTSPLNIVTAQERAEYYGSFRTAFATVRDTAQDGGLTQFSNLPDPGDSTYDGYMNLVFITSPGANILGEATLAVDLQTGVTSGNATGFLGVIRDDAMIDQVVSYEGNITLSGGNLTAASNGAAGFDLQIDGELDNGLHTFGVDGQLNGYLFGADADGLRVIGSSSALNDDINLIIDGTEVVEGNAAIWALKQ